MDGSPFHGEPLRDAQVEQLRIPPQCVEAEQAVLGGLMLRAEAWPLVSELLTEEDFYRRDHQLIWRAVKALAERGRAIDAVTIGDFLVAKGFGEQVGGGAYIVELASTTPSAANIVAYAEIVGEKSRMRKLIEVGTGMVNDGFQPDGREFAEILADVHGRVVELQPAQRGGLRLASESLGRWYDDFCERYDNNRPITGLPTPWKEFNRITHGLQPATLYLIASRPNMGKSVAGGNLAMFTALRDDATALFSVEMSEAECHARNIASLAEIPHDWVVAPNRQEDHTAALNEARRKLNAAALWIDDTPGLTVRQFEARARRRHQRNPLRLIVIDHIHDFTIDPKLARFEIGRIAQCAKGLAKEWNIPVVALAQLNRQVAGRGDKRPTLSDLRESGELEQKADVIVFLHREDYYDTPQEKTHLQGVVEMHFAKGRNIRSGERIYLRNRFDEMRLDDWEGPLPSAPKAKTKGEVGFVDPGDDERKDIFG